MFFARAVIFSILGCASAASLPGALSAIAPNVAVKRNSGGVTLPVNATPGVYEHSVDPVSGEVTTTLLEAFAEDEILNSTNWLVRRDTSSPPWPNINDVDVTCEGFGLPSDLIATGANALGNWCDRPGTTLNINSHVSFVVNTVYVFVCNWAQTITNDCSSAQLLAALSQSVSACGAGMSSSNAYGQWYKAYGAELEGHAICHQEDPENMQLVTTLQSSASTSVPASTSAQASPTKGVCT